MAGVLAELISRSGCAQRGTSFRAAIAGPQLHPLGGFGLNAALHTPSDPAETAFEVHVYVLYNPARHTSLSGTLKSLYDSLTA